MPALDYGSRLDPIKLAEWPQECEHDQTGQSYRSAVCWKGSAAPGRCPLTLATAARFALKPPRHADDSPVYPAFFPRSPRLPGGIVGALSKDF
jgi:hypothetical protein